MKQRQALPSRSESGAAAAEFAVLLPVMCLIALAMANGWSLASQVMAMRASVASAANLIMKGATDFGAVETIALANWQMAPADAQLEIYLRYTCNNGAVEVDAASSCTDGDAPTIEALISASAHWTAPFDVEVLTLSRELTDEHVVRVR